MDHPYPSLSISCIQPHSEVESSVQSGAVCPQTHDPLLACDEQQRKAGSKGKRAAGTVFIILSPGVIQQ